MRYSTIRQITSQTLVGYWGEPPFRSGNCFSVLDAEGVRNRILNFGVENYRALGLKDVRICVLEDGYAVVEDDRIPQEWYRADYCKTCTPERFLKVQRAEVADIPKQDGPATFVAK